jgi:hypothetical protein
MVCWEEDVVFPKMTDDGIDDGGVSDWLLA